MKQFIATCESFDEVTQSAGYISEENLKTHFKVYPRFAWWMWFMLKRSGEPMTYCYKGIKYKSLLDLYDANSNEPFHEVCRGYKVFISLERGIIPNSGQK